MRSSLSNRHRRSQIFILVLQAVIVASCSLSDIGIVSDTSRSLSLPLPESSLRTSWSLLQRNRSPNLYELISPLSSNAYVTAIQECDLRKKIPSAALWRQLFVGMQEIKVERQEEVSLGQTPALLSIIIASLDGVPVKLACYTVTQRNCVTDYIMWSQTPVNQTTFEEAFSEQLGFFEDYVKTLLPKQQLSYREIVNTLPS